jgi:integrase
VKNHKNKNEIARLAGLAQAGHNSTAPLAELAQRFLQTAPTPGQCNNLAPISRLVAQIGQMPIGQVTSSHVQQVLTHYHSCSQRFYLANFKRFFRWCQDEGYLPLNLPNPAGSIRIMIPAAPNPQVLTPAELRKLLAGTTDVEVQLWLALSAFAGLRTGEIERLSWDSIEPGRHIYLRRQLSNSGKARQVPIRPVLDAWLKPFYGSHGPAVKSRTVPQRLCRVIRTLALDLRRNMLRHSCLAYRYRLAADSTRICLEMGLHATLFNLHRLVPVTKADAQEFFSLTPEVVGIQDWPALVAEYRRSAK